MEQMRVEMTFDKKAVEENGYSLDRIYTSIKKAFAEKNLPCVSDNEVLAFSENGKESDWSSLWHNTSRLMRSPWFLKCAKTLLFIEEGEAEDVLSQTEVFEQDKKWEIKLV